MFDIQEIEEQIKEIQKRDEGITGLENIEEKIREMASYREEAKAKREGKRKYKK